MINASVSVKQTISHRTYEKYYAWNAGTCACECDKDCKIGE